MILVPGGSAGPSVGNVANNAADAGNPVKIGGKVSTAAPAALAAGQRVDAWFSPQGAFVIGLMPDGLVDALGARVLRDTNNAGASLGVAPGAYNGASWDRRRTPARFVDVNGVAVGAIATVWTPTAGKKFRLMGGVISLSAAGNLLFEDNAGGAFVFRVGGLLVATAFQFTLGGNGFLSAAANNVLKATSSVAANLTGTLYGTEE